MANGSRKLEHQLPQRLRLTTGVLAVLLVSVPVASAQEQVEYYGSDAVGSIRIVFDAGGAVKGRMEYGPFGEELAPGLPIGSNVYAGLFRDGEINLDYANARMYQNRTGRFTRPDPMSGDTSEPQLWNRYTYALNNPLVFADFSGLWPVPMIGPCQLGLCFSDRETVVGRMPYGLLGGNGRSEGCEICDRDPDPPVGGADDGSSADAGDPFVPTEDPPDQNDPKPIECPAVPFTITGIAPNQARGRTSITQVRRAQIPDGGVAIKPMNFGVPAVNNDNRNVLAGIRLQVDWTTAAKPNRRTPAVPRGLPSRGPYTPVDVIGPAAVRNAPGNQIDVYNYTSYKQAFASTRTAQVTAVIPPNSAGVRCPQ